MLSGSEPDCALFVATGLVTAGGGERTLDLGSEDLVSRSFPSTNEMSRPGKSGCAKLCSFGKSLCFLICQVGALIWGSLMYCEDQI